MKIEFEKKSTLGRGNYTLVKQMVTIGPNHSKYKKGGNNTYMIEKGRISEHPHGYFQYYEPVTNELNPTFREDDFEAIKERVKHHLGK